ncbi:NUDIX hydrolase [Herbidospora daliensis]|uniref:NUDIX hydrolase n=1 Tax=Herbidospora daliensis TaxID=295585 RepID=UPI0007860009|nr:NUDIX hydrolase [Herbidospora daliensis]
MTDVIHAAGAVIWRGAETSPEVALVHRPKYDDWSFPKGKLKAGEHVITGALREVREETGLSVVLGRSLPPVHYLKDGRLKRVDYWAARVSAEDDLTAVDEVDEVVWMPLDEARDRLTYEWDAGLLRALTAAPLVTVPLILVRHGLAGSRSEWKGHDDRRPLDADGLAQAEVVAEALSAYAPRNLVSSPSRRCTQTLKPYATASDLSIRKEKLLSEPGYDPKDTLRLVRKLTEPTAVCSHGKVLPDLLGALCEGRIGDTHLRKGGFAVLHHAEGELVSVDRYVT